MQEIAQGKDLGGGQRQSDISLAGGPKVRRLMLSASLVCALAPTLPATAALPEPDTIVWGDITDPNGFAALPGTVVEVRRGVVTGDLLASYTIDHAGPAGTSFVTRVSMVHLEGGDSLGPDEVEVGAGETARIVVDGQDIGLSVPVDERGGVQAVDYSGWSLADADGDLLPDYYENQVGSDVNVADSDGDGMDDYLEYLAGSDPNDAGDIPVRAGAGDVDGDGEVTMGDVVLLMRYVADGVGSVSLAAGDLAPLGGPAGDGLINVADVMLITRLAKGDLKRVPDE